MNYIIYHVLSFHNPPRRVAGSVEGLACMGPSSQTNIKIGLENEGRVKEGRKGNPPLRVLHYNCQGLVVEARLYEFEKVLEKIN